MRSYRCVLKLQLSSILCVALGSMPADEACLLQRGSETNTHADVNTASLKHESSRARKGQPLMCDTSLGPCGVDDVWWVTHDLWPTGKGAHFTCTNGGHATQGQAAISKAVDECKQDWKQKKVFGDNYPYDTLKYYYINGPAKIVITNTDNDAANKCSGSFCN